MNDDYLWDKTGEPDPQVQQLEQILGSLRYQPKPLELPEELPRRRNYFLPLAIAAGVLLALLAGGIWLNTRSPRVAPPHEARVTPAPPVKEVTPTEVRIPEPKPEPREEVAAVVHKRRPRPSAPVLSTAEREEALLAKEQVMLALRLTTEKLSLVHKKTQTTPASQIKNQHRIG